MTTLGIPRTECTPLTCGVGIVETTGKNLPFDTDYATWSRHAATLAFDRQSIRTLVPKGTRLWATYALLRDGEVVYVGATEQPRVRLFAHLRAREADEVKIRFHRYQGNMARTERALIESLHPEGNRKPGSRHGQWHARHLERAS